MSRKFKVPLGLVGISANPSSGEPGDTYFNTSDKLIYTYDGTKWVSSNNLVVLDGGTPASLFE